MYFNPDDVPNRFPNDVLKTLVDREYDFYGVDNNTFCIGSNGSRMALEALEDESDGYRSYFGCFATSPVGKIFFGTPVARVKFVDSSEGPFSGWSLVDVVTGHVWLRVGTDNLDDYYPCFTFDYTPDTTKEIES